MNMPSDVGGDCACLIYWIYFFFSSIIWACSLIRCHLHVFLFSIAGCVFGYLELMENTNKIMG